MTTTMMIEKMTKTGTLGKMTGTETMEEEVGGTASAATATETAEVRN